MRIAFFDSGIGGVTVLHQALRQMPDEEYLYFADTDHVPYGVKTPEEILGFVTEAVDFIMAQEVKALVVACNTATSVAIEALRRRFDTPVLGMEPAVKPAVCHLAEDGGRRVLVAATPVTLRERKLKHLLTQWDQEHMVDLLPLPRLVSFAEKGQFTGDAVRSYLQEAFAPYPMAEYCTLVLGCTHFNLFKDTLRAILPSRVQIIDGSAGTVRHLAATLEERGLREHDGAAKITFYTSGRMVSDAGELARYQALLRRLDVMLTIS